MRRSADGFWDHYIEDLALLLRVAEACDHPHPIPLTVQESLVLQRVGSRINKVVHDRTVLIDTDLDDDPEYPRTRWCQ